MFQKAKTGGKDEEESNYEVLCKDLKDQTVELKPELSELMVLCLGGYYFDELSG